MRFVRLFIPLAAFAALWAQNPGQNQGMIPPPGQADPGLNGGRLLSSVLRIAVAAAVMGVAAAVALPTMETWIRGEAIVIQAVRLALVIGFALVVLAASAWVLRISEFKQGVAMVTRRLRRSSR